MTVQLHVSSVSFNCIVFASILFSFVLLSYSVIIVFYFVLGTSLCRKDLSGLTTGTCEKRGEGAGDAARETLQ